MKEKLLDLNVEEIIKKSTTNVKKLEKSSGNAIAIIGIGIKLPQANHVEDFWNLVKHSVDCVDDFPESRKKDIDNYINSKNTSTINKYKKGAYLNDIDKFDCTFFNISPREASLMDPNQRLFLETAYDSVRDAGYVDRIKGSNTGVYVGWSNLPINAYANIISDIEPTAFEISFSANLPPMTSSRISYFLDLKGPSMVIDTACSSSLVAVHLACQAIKQGDCDMAIAGGAKINLFPFQYTQKLGIESSDGKAKTFDDKSDGTGDGEGVVAILLKPLDRALQDGDNIYATIKGSAINQDGYSLGITAPNAIAQENVITKAWQEAEINPETIAYVEVHGTGTKLGDPIEINGLTRAFENFTDKKQFCAVSALKTNIGHLDTVAGIAGLIKAVMALKKKQIPPLIHFSIPNNKIDFCKSPIYVNDKLRKWESNNIARRCGVSSFGLSGTNCHVVLEEAPISSKPENINHYNIMTLSAKNKSILEELIKQYKYFLSNDDDIDIQEVCYTQNAARPHYNHRLAIVFSDIQDLRKKVQLLDYKKDFEDCEDVYYGDIENVGDKGSTEEKRKQLTFLEEIEVNEFEVDKGSNKEIICNLCSLYVKGASIKWEYLYRNKNYKKISVPKYPFLKRRCWVETKDIYKEDNFIVTLVGKNVVESMNIAIYKGELEANKYWILKEHKIQQNSIFPGSAFLEIASQVGKKHYNSSVIEIKEFMLLSPLIVRENDKVEVQTIINTEKEYLQLTIVSKSKLEDHWKKNVECKILRSDKKALPLVDIDNIKSRLIVEKEVKIDDIDSIIKTGSRWNNLKKAFIGTNELIVELELPNEYINDLNEYILHPSLLDNAINAAVRSIGKGTYLPFYFGKISIFSSIPAKLVSYIFKKKDEQQDSLTATFDIKLIDNEGNVCIEVEDYVVKKIDVNKFQLSAYRGDDELFYDINWVVSANTEYIKSQQLGNILVVKDSQFNDTVVLKQLYENYSEVIEVQFGDFYKCISPNNFVVSSSESDSIKLLKDIGDKKINDLLYLTNTREKLEENYLTRAEQHNNSLLCLFNFFKAFIKKYMSYNMKILMVANHANQILGDEKNINPLSSAVIGFAKVISQEYENFKVKCIDADNNIDLHQILSEMNNEFNELCVAYRNGIRYIGEFTQSNIQNVPVISQTFRDEGVYIITGGTGGIGFEISKALAKYNNIKLCWIGRTKISPELSLEHNDYLKVQNIKLQIETIRNLGIDVSYYCADVTCVGQMEAVIKEIKEKYTKINGVIHCAGLPGKGYLFQKSQKDFKEVISPKVLGVNVMDYVLRNERLEFMVLFSSISSIIGGLGQSDYAAANAYLDSYAFYRTQNGKKTVVINWCAWNGIGMASDRLLNGQADIFKDLEAEHAIRAFEHVIDRDITRIIIGKLNYKSDFLHDNNKYPVKVSDEVKKQILVYIKDKNNMNDDKEINHMRNKFILKGRSNEDYTVTENILSQVWADILGLDEINIYENIYNQGGDSILATRIVNEANKKMDKRISLSDIFQYPSIYELGIYLDGITNDYHTTKSNSEKHTINEKDNKEYELSSAQSRMWFLQKFNPNMTAYNLPFKTFIKLNLDITCMNKAFNYVISRHSSLRTVFIEKNGEVRQIILKTYNAVVEVINLTNENSKEATLKSLIDKERKYIFDMAKPLLKMMLFKLAEDEYCLYFNIHHIITDGWSTRIFFEELMEAYNSYNESRSIRLKPLEISYIEWVDQQNRWINSEEAREAENYWLKELAKPLPIISLSEDFVRPEFQNYEGSYIIQRLDEQLSIKLKKLSARLGTTLHTTLLSAYFVLINKLSCSEDIVIGFPKTQRESKELENVIGLFVNTLCIRVNFSELGTFDELVDYVKQKSIKAYSYGKYPFDLLVTKVNPERDLTRSPIFTTFFQYYEDIPQEHEGISLYDFSLYCKNAGEQIELRIEYNTDLFKKDTIQRYMTYFLNILSTVIDESNVRFRNIDILSSEEKTLILTKFNNTEVDYPSHLTLKDFLETQANQNPSNIAVRSKDNELSYNDLNNCVNKLANNLIEKGIQPGEIIGIMIERSIEMIIGIYAIIKAGGAYLPIDPLYPQERVSYIINDSRTSLILTKGKYINKCSNIQYMLIDEFSTPPCNNVPNPQRIIHPEDLAYVIYTSGSTGNPKGAMIQHYSVVNRINWMQKKYSLTDRDLIMQKTSFTFDVSVWEIFWWAYAGAGVFLINSGGEKDPEDIVTSIEKYDISIIHFVPTMLSLFLKHIKNNDSATRLKKLKYVFSSGEELKSYDVKRFNNLLFNTNRTKLINLYGPTEATVDVSYYECSSEKNLEIIPIGKPIDNIRIYILDRDNQLQPIGIPGELYIAGVGVGKGYCNNSDLTNQLFIEDPFYQGQRMYKTGDMCKWLPDGNIQFIGRIDNQVKIRGYRIEKSEIEAHLLEHKSVNRAMVIDKEDKEGKKFLCAYIESNIELSVKELRDFLTMKLPDYMVPTSFIILPKFPLLPNGKLSTRELPQPDSYIHAYKKLITPDNQKEELLRDIWSEVLELDKKNISVTDNFFDLGGNSISLLQVHAKVKNHFGGNITLVNLFSYPTIRKLAYYLGENKENELVKIVLNPLVLPERYFCKGINENEGTSIQFSINETMTKNLFHISKSKDINLNYILFSLFMYLMAEASKQSYINIESMILDENVIDSVQIDINSLESLDELFNIVKNQIQHLESQNKYFINDLKKVESIDKSNSVAVFFYEKSMLTEKYELSNVFDIIIEFCYQNNKLNFFCDFNYSKLSRDGVLELVNGYTDLIKIFLDDVQ